MRKRYLALATAIALLAFWLIPAEIARADAFNYLTTPVDVTPGSSGLWQDVDNANVPDGASGVFLQICNTSGGALACGVRKNGSTDTRTNNIWDNHQIFAFMGCDASGVFEAYIGSTSLKIYLLGYTSSGVTFFTNAYDKSLSSISAWTDIDCSGQAPSAVGLIFENVSTAAYSYGYRKNGSSDNRYNIIDKHTWFVVGCDASQVAEGYITNTAVDTFLVGYITSGATFLTNGTSYTTSTEGSYIDEDITPSSAGEATGAILEIIQPSTKSIAIRKNGAAYDYYHKDPGNIGAIVQVDGDEIFEEKTEWNNATFYLLGWTTVAEEPPPSTKHWGFIF